ncbi:hypothetical protein FB451DRAFT_1183887 [Mycena latifolia]|nr:hypothetical protein FB451DRAFT_1183887 [Mycena latifolia]
MASMTTTVFALACELVHLQQKKGLQSLTNMARPRVERGIPKLNLKDNLSMIIGCGPFRVQAIFPLEVTLGKRGSGIDNKEEVQHLRGFIDIPITLGLGLGRLAQNGLGL